MTRETLEALIVALEASPENEILRLQVGKGHFDLREFQEAKNHFDKILQSSRNPEAKFYLAKSHFELGNLSTGIIICEDLNENNASHESWSLYIRLLLEDGQEEEAVKYFQQFLEIDNSWDDLELRENLTMRNVVGDPESGEDNDTFLEKPDISFEHVGGMDAIKEDIKIKIIHPLNNPELFAAYGKKTGGGILLYGPPGCGKTYLAKATAGEIKSKFLSLGLEEVLDMYIGNSERNLHDKFELGRRNNPCVMFFDEIDALGSKRNDLKHSAGRNVINQFLKEMDGIDSDNEGLLILGATNSPWHMDSAFLRPGRFDRIIFVPPPDESAREIIFKLQLTGKPIEKIDYKKLAKRSQEFSGADIQLTVDMAVEDKLRSSMKTGKIEPITTSDLTSTLKKVRPSTKDWFQTARNYALYSNASGLYDEVLTYLKLD